MLAFIKFIFFVFSVGAFGFTLLSQVLKIKSTILLVPLSISFGIATFLFTCHVISFFIGPQASSILSLCILLVIAIVILLIKRKEIFKLELELKKSQFVFLYIYATLITILTFIALSKYGTFDREAHIPMAMTIIHNNVYPPRDPFRPDYVLLYHYGGDLLAACIHHLTKLDISSSFEAISTIFSFTTYLSFFALAWLLTRNFKLSFIAGFCAYLGGGLLWLDAIIRYLTKNFPDSTSNWTFLQTFLNLGLHGGINNASSVLMLTSTFSFGIPVLILCLILLWKMTFVTNVKSIIFYILCLNVSLFSLSLTTDWLFVTFWAGVIPLLLFLFLKKERKIIKPILIILLISILLNKSLGNALFLQDTIQNLGRTNIYDIGIKENLFTVVGWGRLSSLAMNYQTISCFSWEFVSEIGLALFLLPIAFFYVLKTKQVLGYLLLFSALMTVPVPTVIDFKLSPVDLVRFFNFGISMLILLIICGIALLYKPFLQKNILIFTFMSMFCLSPISELISGVIFSPSVFIDKNLVEAICSDLKKKRSFNDIKDYFLEIDEISKQRKNQKSATYKSEIDFLKAHIKPKDVAISSLVEVPSYSGVYSIIPPRQFIYWDQLYSSYNLLYDTILTTFDPYLLNELNIKWLLVSNVAKSKLPLDIQETLNKESLFKLVYISPPKKNEEEKQFEIYHIDEVSLSNLIRQQKRKAAWTLANKKGQLLTLDPQEPNKIILFGSSREALSYLKKIKDMNLSLKKELIIAQPIDLSRSNIKI